MIPEHNTKSLISEIERQLEDHNKRSNCPITRNVSNMGTFLEDWVDSAVITEYQDNPAFLLGVTSGILRMSSFVGDPDTDTLLQTLLIASATPDENGVAKISANRIGEELNHIMYHVVAKAVLRYKRVQFFEGLGVLEKCFQVKVVEETEKHYLCQVQNGVLAGKRFRLPKE